MSALDTSGIVLLPRPGAEDRFKDGWRFEDLDPFTQGYVEAMMEANRHGALLKAGRGGVCCGFSDLAPETLARIMEDCAAHERAHGVLAHDPRRNNRGKNFWRNRVAGMWASSGWPPLTVILCDDGKVRFQ